VLAVYLIVVWNVTLVKQMMNSIVKRVPIAILIMISRDTPTYLATRAPKPLEVIQAATPFMNTSF
jgi:hypothetical protein